MKSATEGRHRVTSDPTAGLRPIADPHDGGAWAAPGLRTLAGAAVVAWAFRLSGYLTLDPWLAFPVALLGLGGLLVIVVGWFLLAHC